MKKLLMMLVVLMGVVVNVHAGWGYCYECRCSKFDRDHLVGSSSQWYCTCGHRYEEHLNASRPDNSSFGGRTVYDGGSSDIMCSDIIYKKKGFFDKGENVFFFISAIAALIYGFATKKWTSSAVGIPLLWFIKALLK